MMRKLVIAWGWLMAVVVARPVLAFAKWEQDREGGAATSERES